MNDNDPITITLPRIHWQAIVDNIELAKHRSACSQEENDAFDLEAKPIIDALGQAPVKGHG